MFFGHALNPARAKLIRPEAALESFRWSSYGEYLKRLEQRPKWLRVDRLLGERGIPKDSAAGREEFGRQMERRRQEEESADYRWIQRGWRLGGWTYVSNLLNGKPRH